MHTRYWIVVIVALLLAGLSACGGPASPTPAPTDAVGPDAASPIATPDAAFASPLFVSPLAAPPATLEPVPTPAPNKSTVTGVLMLIDNLVRPMPSAILYLAEVIKTDDGRPAMSGLDKQHAPGALTNAAGQFIFKDVPPGEYVLIFDLVIHSFVLDAPTGGEMIIDVPAGQVVDLGEMRYNDLPGTARPTPQN